MTSIPAAGERERAALDELQNLARDIVARRPTELAARGEGHEPKRLGLDVAARLAAMPTPPLPAEISPEAEAKRLADAAERDRQTRRAVVIRQVGRRYAGASVDNFAVSNSAQAIVLGDVKGYIDTLEQQLRDGAGVVFMGPPGTGKDHLATAVLLAAADKGYRVGWVDGVELFASARDNIDGGVSEARWTEKFTAPDFLLISDPVPPVGAVKEGFQIATLFRIIDRRYRDMKPTLLTINAAKKEEAEARISANVIDRLADRSLVLKCFWGSHRKAK